MYKYIFIVVKYPHVTVFVKVVDPQKQEAGIELSFFYNI